MNFLYDVMQGNVDEDLLCEVRSRVPKLCSRQKEIFSTIQLGKGAIKQDFLNRDCVLYNQIENKPRGKSLNILSQSKKEFRAMVQGERVNREI